MEQNNRRASFNAGSGKLRDAARARRRQDPSGGVGEEEKGDREVAAAEGGAGAAGAAGIRGVGAADGDGVVRRAGRARIVEHSTVQYSKLL